MESEDKRGYIALYIITALSLLILLVYWPVLSCDFINYDDPFYVTANSHVTAGLSIDSIRWAFTTFFFYNWHPITWISHMLDVQLFGLNPLGHHLTSLLLHIANSLLLFILFRKMTRSTWKSASVALLFALHPLHVQSVAWVAERKDVLSTFFWLLVMLAYTAYASKPKLAAYLLCILLFICGLMAKPMLVTLPFVLLLMDFWPLGRLSWNVSISADTAKVVRQCSFSHLLLEKLPFAGLAIASSIVTFLAQKQGGAVHEDRLLSVDVGNALVSYLQYALKMLWPSRLAVYYPYNPSAISAWQVAVALISLLVATALAIRFGRRFPYIAVGWLWYLGTFVPVIGFLRIGEQAMADRYTYIPLIGLFIIAVWGIADLTQRLRIPKAIIMAVMGIVLIACSVITNLQTRLWHDSVTLFSHAVAVTENNWIAHKNLAAALAKQGNYAEALNHATESLRIKPEPLEFVSQGWLYLQLGNYEKAVESCNSALAMSPDNAKAHFIRGVALISLRDYRSALAEYEILGAGNSPYAIQLRENLLSVGIRIQ